MAFSNKIFNDNPTEPEQGSDKQDCFGISSSGKRVKLGWLTVEECKERINKTGKQKVCHIKYDREKEKCGEGYKKCDRDRQNTCGKLSSTQRTQCFVEKYNICKSDLESCLKEVETEHEICWTEADIIG